MQRINWAVVWSIAWIEILILAVKPSVVYLHVADGIKSKLLCKAIILAKIRFSMLAFIDWYFSFLAGCWASSSLHTRITDQERKKENLSSERQVYSRGRQQNYSGFTSRFLGKNRSLVWILKTLAKFGQLTSWRQNLQKRFKITRRELQLQFSVLIFWKPSPSLDFLHSFTCKKVFLKSELDWNLLWKIS